MDSTNGRQRISSGRPYSESVLWMPGMNMPEISIASSKRFRSPRCERIIPAARRYFDLPPDTCSILRGDGPQVRRQVHHRPPRRKVTQCLGDPVHLGADPPDPGPVDLQLRGAQRAQVAHVDHGVDDVQVPLVVEDDLGRWCR